MRSDTSLFEIRIVRELLVLACAAGLLYIGFRIRATLIPIGAAFMFSYALEPVISGLQRRYNVDRRLSAMVTILLLVSVTVFIFVWSAPELIVQLDSLTMRIPQYEEAFLHLLDSKEIKVEGLVNTIFEYSDSGHSPLMMLVQSTGQALGILGTITGITIYGLISILTALVFLFIFTAFAGWERHIVSLVPERRRQLVERVAGHADRAIGTYVRGQLLVAVFTFAGFMIGFYLADVPYWFLVALVGGLFSLIPYGQLSGLLGAVALLLLESLVADVPFSPVNVFGLPTLVYVATQSIESWGITPLIQGESNNLHPALVIVVLILGGSLAGIVGMVLAIPLAATIRAMILDIEQE